MATLLVAVVGATFAYFTATTTGDNVAGSGTGNVTTANLGNTTFTFTGKTLDHSYLNYPGGLAVFGSKAEFTKEATDENAYDLSFDLEIEYLNNTDTDLLWALYVVENDELESSLDPKCKLVTDTETKVGETHYWYNDDGLRTSTNSCTLDSSQTGLLTNTSMLAYGTFKANTDEATKIDSAKAAEAGSKDVSLNPTCSSELCDPNGTTNKILADRPLSLSSGTSSKSVSKYYYLVVQYPNKTTEQEQGSGTPEAPDIQVTLRVTKDSAISTAKNTVSGQS